jgi:hypothetical protein
MLPEKTMSDAKACVADATSAKRAAAAAVSLWLGLMTLLIGD